MYPIYFYEDGEAYVKDMTKVEDSDYWTISIPLPSGGYPYSFSVDGANIPNPVDMLE